MGNFFIKNEWEIKLVNGLNKIKNHMKKWFQIKLKYNILLIRYKIYNTTTIQLFSKILILNGKLLF